MNNSTLTKSIVATDKFRVRRYLLDKKRVDYIQQTSIPAWARPIEDGIKLFLQHINRSDTRCFYIIYVVL